MSLTPQDNDVLFGRGYAIMSHPGNQLLRAMVRSRRENFLRQYKRGAKREIGRDIVNDIHERGGRFLMEDPKNAKSNYWALLISEKTWIRVHTEKAVDKVMHRLRDSRSRTSRGNEDASPSGLRDAAPDTNSTQPSALNSKSSHDVNAQQTMDVPLDGGGDTECPLENATTNLNKLNKQQHHHAISGGHGDHQGSPREPGARRHFFYCLGAENSIESFPLLVADFLKSGLMSRRIILLHRGDKGATAQDDGASSHRPSQNMENTNRARLALLLTCLFVNLLPEMDLASIKLDDFWIDLGRDLTDERIAKSESNLVSDANDTKLESKHDDSSPRGTLLGMYFKSPTTVIDERNCGSGPMQILGQLLYSVFSRSEPFPSDLLITTAPVEGPKLAGDMNGRSSKALRVAKRSVFSRLIESNSFPVSICRLISDMVDTGSNGRATHPFSSLDAVINDLEQMINQPERFLHDSCFPRGVPLQPMFGQALHGREKEIGDIRRVANRMEQSLHRANLGSSNLGFLDAIFVSGIAGSGKSHLAQAIEDKLSPGWIVVKAKFERGKEHASRRIVSSMFDQLIVNLVKMKESGKLSDAARFQQVSNSILQSVGYDTLPLLVDFLPSLSSLFDNLSGDKTRLVQAEDAEFSLAYSISKIIEALLESDWLIMICCDDLQWADKTSLSLMSNVLVNIGNFRNAFSRCMFFGLFRLDEIDDNHPFTILYSNLQMTEENARIKVTNIKLSSLSKKDIGNMLMAELRLPQRFVAPLADAVHKKTSGHAFFVAELLNSLLRSSVLVYSSQQRRYTWDQDAINLIQLGDGVAGLIASNLKSLTPASQRVLQILSCFGIQTDVPLLRHLESFQDGIISSLDTFVEMGILDRAGPLVIFTHDLIQQGVYEIASLAERQKLHLEMGRFLAGRAKIDDSLTIDPLTTSVDQLKLDGQEFYAGNSMTSSLIALACDQIDSVGLDVVADEAQRVTFARWNLCGGKHAYRQCNPHSALYYFSKAISFLGQDRWHAKHFKLCLALHKGAVMASFRLGEPEMAAQYAEKIASNSYGKFEDSLEILPILLCSLSQTAKHKECISKGMGILRQLNFEIPDASSPKSLMNFIAVTDSIASKFSMDQMMNLCEKAVDGAVLHAFRIIDAILPSCFVTSSRFMPFVACATVQFSLKHGICHESATAFGIFGMLKIFSEDYAGGRYWADVVRAIMRKIGTTHFRPEMLMCFSTDIWFMCPRVIAQKLLLNHQNAMRNGFIDTAMLSLQIGWRFKLFGGEQLSLVYKSSEDRLKLLTKHSQFAAKRTLLDSLLLVELTGKSGDYFSAFGGSICNMKDLQDSAISSNDFDLVHNCHCTNVLIEYWRGNYLAAEESSRLASMMAQESRTPTLLLIYHIFFRGIILFQLYRTHGDEKRLKDGKEMMDRVEKWALVSMIVFENKWLLLKAEYCSSINDFDQALQMYEGSINSAQDQGNIHELALAYELLGKFYSRRGSRMASNECFKKACVYYSQWGAHAVAKKVLRDHNLEMDSTAWHVQTQKKKR